jgi:hypothetical protein
MCRIAAAFGEQQPSLFCAHSRSRPRSSMSTVVANGRMVRGATTKVPRLYALSKSSHVLMPSLAVRGLARLVMVRAPRASFSRGDDNVATRRDTLFRHKGLILSLSTTQRDWDAARKSAWTAERPDTMDGLMDRGGGLSFVVGYNTTQIASKNCRCDHPRTATGLF